jgi:hypothetical protein
MARLSRLQFAIDVSAADWVVARVGPFGSGVGGLVPHGFEAYARILHPAWEAGDRPVAWAEVAAWSGRVVHPRVQFEAIARPAAGDGITPRPWQNPPDPGTLPPELLSALCGILAAHTGTPGRCWFCAWDGYSRPPGPDAMVTSTGPGGAADEPMAPRVLPPQVPPGVASIPEVLLPKRPYLLLEGPLDAAGELGMTLYDQSPSLFWPDDHAWLVTTDVDLDSTYLGGSAALVRDLLADERLEAVPASATDPVWASSDDINQ